MRAGELRHRITFQTQVPGADAEGQPNGAWTNVATVWAAVEDLNTRELVRGGITGSEVTTRIRCRHRTDITTGMRAVQGARTLEITGPPIDHEGRGRELEILCREIDPKDPTP